MNLPSKSIKLPFLQGKQIEAFWYVNLVYIAEKSLLAFLVTDLKALFVDLNYDLCATGKLFQITNK